MRIVISVSDLPARHGAAQIAIEKEMPMSRFSRKLTALMNVDLHRVASVMTSLMLAAALAGCVVYAGPEHAHWHGYWR